MYLTKTIDTPNKHRTFCVDGMQQVRLKSVDKCSEKVNTNTCIGKQTMETDTLSKMPLAMLSTVKTADSETDLKQCTPDYLIGKLREMKKDTTFLLDYV